MVSDQNMLLECRYKYSCWVSEIQSILDLADFDLAETLDLADDNLVPSEFLLSKILSI